MWDGVAVLGMIVCFVGGWWLIETWLKTSESPPFARHLIAAPIGVLSSFVFVIVMYSLGLVGNETSARQVPKEKKETRLDDSELVSLFSVTDEIQLPDRRTVEVRLHRRIREKTLKRIAERINETGDDKQVSQTFIGYRLAQQDPSSTYWATTHFSSELTLRIAGLTPREVEALQAFDVDEAYDEPIGSWIVERGFNYLAVAYIDDAQVFIDHVYPEGDIVTKEYRTSELDNGGLRLQAVDDAFGDYFTIGAQGNLRYWSENENYVTAAPLDPESINLELDDVELSSSLPPKRAELVLPDSETLSNEVQFNGRGHAACASEESLDEILRAAIDSDQRGINRLLDGDCVIPRAGLPVSVQERSWGGKVQVKAQTVGDEKRYWTVADALSARDS